MDSSNNNNIIFLIGFMGCGKSVIGKRIARIKGWEFVDLDTMIKENEGCSIAEIFKKNGEQYFRQAETDCLTQIHDNLLQNSQGMVIATGGGCAINPVNAQIMKETGIVVFLDVRFENIIVRIENDKSRPLAKDSSTIQELFYKRRPIYLNHCHVRVRENAYPRKMSQKVIHAIEVFGR